MGWKTEFTNVTWRTATLTRQDQDKHSAEVERDGGIVPKIVAGCGTEKTNVELRIITVTGLFQNDNPAHS